MKAATFVVIAVDINNLNILFLIWENNTGYEWAPEILKY